MHASQQSTPLHDAAFNGDITAVKTLIEAGASLNAKNSEGKTPIQVATDKALENDEHWTVVKTIAEVCLGEFDGTKNFSYALSHAILAVKLDVIEALIRAGTDLSAKNSEGKTPIQVAAGKAFADPKFWPVVEKIAQTCPDDQNNTKHYGSALLTAVQIRKFDTAQILLRAKASTKWITVNKHTCLHHAAALGDIEMLRLLIQAGANLDAKDKYGKTPIQVATDKALTDEKYWAVVETIARLSPNTEHCINDYGYALLMAVKSRRLDTVKILLQKNAIQDIWKTKSDGWNRVHHAAASLDIPMLTALIQAEEDYLKGNSARTRPSSNLEMKDIHGKTPMQVATDKACSDPNFWAVVETIATLSPEDLDHKKAYGHALIFAIIHGQTRTVQVLLEAKTSSNWITTKDKHTCLHHAAKNNNIEILTSLMRAEANLKAQDIDGLTPIEVAANNNNWQAVICIAQLYRPDSNDFEHFGKVLQLAAKYNQTDAVAALLSAGIKSDLIITWDTVRNIGNSYNPGLSSRFKAVFGSSAHPHHQEIAAMMSNGALRQFFVEKLRIDDPKLALMLAYRILDNTDKTELAEPIRAAYRSAGLATDDLESARINRTLYSETWRQNFEGYLHMSFGLMPRPSSTPAEANEAARSSNVAASVASVPSTAEGDKISLVFAEKDLTPKEPEEPEPSTLLERFERL